ncbi:hypothetical protein AB4Z50_35440 [Paenibacillus sp. 2TAB26]|uniref:hypothetical protein n=1 Tax=Paenibacillus sp. 2TAB26 TaxID=3233005 RepID=UPI003F94662E
MKGLYYHPDRILDESTTIIDQDRYAAITMFLDLVETITPEVAEDLQQLHDTYVLADLCYVKQYSERRLWPSSWEIVKKSDHDYCPEYIPLKEAILDWASKFNLLGNHEFYHSLGLTSLSFYYDDCKDLNRKGRMKEYRAIAKQYNVPLEAVRQSERFSKSWPHQEKLVLAENVFQEDESDTIELSRSIGNDENLHSLFFEQTFPFIFSPDSLTSFFKKDENVDVFMFETMKTHYELMLCIYDSKKEEAIKEGIPLELPQFSGLAWDPRNETWKNFEQSMDQAYAEYKQLYRERAESFLKDRGYVKEKEKRNLDHFKWLVHYLVQKWTLREIADKYSGSEFILSEDTIFHGLKSAARMVLIDLKQRK